jgi:triosephosphate isomerase
MKKLIVGNWKLYVSSLSEGKKLLRAIDKSFPRGVKSTVVICPPVALAVALRASYGGKRISFGTQDASFESEGKHTGEISPRQLKESGIDYVIVGHIERREKGDTDEIVSKKVAAALSEKLHPILCVGEPERDQEGHFFEYLKKNIVSSLSRVASSDAKNLTIAYDPLWAIGNAEAPAPSVIREASVFIRKTLSEIWGREAAEKVRIIYGGSVDAENADMIAEAANIDGVLPGRASVDPEIFCQIIKAFRA